MIAYVHTIGDYVMNAKKLWNNEKKSYFSVIGTVRIKQVKNGPYKNITYVNDLRALFPEEQISMP